MKFIVHTPADHPGIRLYVVRKDAPSRGIELRGFREEAIEFPTLLDAEVAADRFSSLHGLVITGVTG